MNSRAVFALALVLLMVLPVIPAITPKAASNAGVVVPSTVVGPNSEVAFFINVTFLRQAQGWVGSQIQLYWSNNGLATIDQNDVPINLSNTQNNAIYVAGVDYVAGTVRAPSINVLNNLIGSSDTGYIYLKVSDGSNVAVSARILVVKNIAEYIKVNNEKLAYVPGILGTTNTFDFLANLTEINSKLDPGSKIEFNTTSENFTVSALLVSDGISLTAAEAVNVSNNTVYGGVTSNVFNLGVFEAVTNSSGTIVHFNGTLLDFPINSSFSLGTEDYKGIMNIHAAQFDLLFQILGTNTTFLNGTIRVVLNNYVQDALVNNFTVPDMKLTLSYSETIEIYPSVGFVGLTDDPDTPSGQANVGDQVTLEIHNYPAGSSAILVRIFRYDEASDSFSSLTMLNLTGSFTTASDGSATITFNLPAQPYGGLSYTFTVCVFDSTGALIRGLPATNTTSNSILLLTIYPYLKAYAALPDGTFRTTIAGPTAPGDYILVKGYGFLQENINLTGNLASNLASVLFDVEELVSYGASGHINVFPNGSFVAIAKIPSTAWTDNNFSIVANGATATDVGTHSGVFYFDLGNDIDGVEKVYVNPVPVIKAMNDTYIELGISPAYPYPATWEDEASRIFTVEAIGLDANVYQTVNVNLTGSPANVVIAANETPTNGYLLLEDIPVPVVPYGDYNVTVYNASTNQKVTTAFPQVHVRATAALQDPLTGNWTKTVSIIGITDVNVTGYGWPASVPMEWDINELKMLGYENFTIKTLDKSAQAYTDEHGYFIGLLETSLYITTPGMYHITIHPENSNITDIVTLNIGTAPALLAIVDTAKTKVTGDYVDVWILVKFSNEELATPDKVSEVRVYVYAYTDAGLISVNSPAGELATYTGVPGLWHYTFYLNPNLKGEDLAVLVEAKGQYLPYLPLQEAHDLAALTVSGELVNMIEDINNKLVSVNNSVVSINDTVSSIAAKLNDISSTLDTLQTRVTTIGTTVDSIQTTLGTVSTDLGKLQDSVNSLSNKIDSAKSDLANAINKVGSDTTSSIDSVKSSIKNYGLASIVLLIIVLIVAAYGAFARKG